MPPPKKKRTSLTLAQGVPHILEHSVLCGSRKYPIKAGLHLSIGACISVLRGEPKRGSRHWRSELGRTAPRLAPAAVGLGRVSMCGGHED